MEKTAKIFIAGHNGLVGSALTSLLKKKGFNNLILVSKKELDLTRQNEVDNFFSEKKPDYVFLCAAKVGNIRDNFNYPADFILENLLIQTNVIFASYKYGVKKLMFFGTSCMYPKFAKQPMKESYLLTDLIEKTNEPYAIAKIAGWKLCESFNRQYNTKFITVIPANLYGPNDRLDDSGHVVPSLFLKFYNAIKTNTPPVIWGTGKAKREFFYVDDCADACLFLMDNYEENFPVNVGTSVCISIKELSGLIARIVGYKGKIIFDKTKPDGAPIRLLDSTKIRKMGWKPSTSLETGLNRVWEWMQKKINF